MDMAELKFVGANVTSIRMMSPYFDEVQNAVHDWRKGEIRVNGTYGINADRIKV